MSLCGMADLAGKTARLTNLVRNLKPVCPLKLCEIQDIMCAAKDMSVQRVGVTQLSMEEELDNELKDDYVCMVQCRRVDDTTACRMGTEQPDECVCTLHCTGQDDNSFCRRRGFGTEHTGGRGDRINIMHEDDGQSERRRQIG